jgi:hypothetical protein
MNILEIEKKLKSGGTLTTAEQAFIIGNHPAAFWAFLVANNPGNLNDTLRTYLGYKTLSFQPDGKTISRIITTLIEKGDTNALNTLLHYFKFNPNIPIDNGLKTSLIKHLTNNNTGSAKQYYIGKDGIKYEKTF